MIFIALALTSSALAANLLMIANVHIARRRRANLIAAGLCRASATHGPAVEGTIDHPANAT